jgi:hypothetical protein
LAVLDFHIICLILLFEAVYSLELLWWHLGFQKVIVELERLKWIDGKWMRVWISHDADSYSVNFVTRLTFHLIIILVERVSQVNKLRI